MSALPELLEQEIEKLAVKHEAFGFGLVDAKGYTTHGFDPDGLHAFVAELRAFFRKQALEEAVAWMMRRNETHGYMRVCVKLMKKELK